MFAGSVVVGISVVVGSTVVVGASVVVGGIVVVVGAIVDVVVGAAVVVTTSAAGSAAAPSPPPPLITAVEQAASMDAPTTISPSATARSTDRSCAHRKPYWWVRRRVRHLTKFTSICHRAIALPVPRPPFRVGGRPLVLVSSGQFRLVDRGARDEIDVEARQESIEGDVLTRRTQLDRRADPVQHLAARSTPAWSSSRIVTAPCRLARR